MFCAQKVLFILAARLKFKKLDRDSNNLILEHSKDMTIS